MYSVKCIFCIYLIELFAVNAVLKKKTLEQLLLLTTLRVPNFQLTFTLLTSRADCKSPTRPHHSSRKRETNKGNNGARSWLPHIRKLERKYDLNL